MLRNGDLRLFEVEYNGEGIKVQIKDLTDFSNEIPQPLTVKFVRQIGKKVIWSCELNSNSWATFPDNEMIDTIICDKDDNVLYEKKWDVTEHGNFIYQKLWYTLLKNFHNGKKNYGVVVGTHKGDFGEWVPIIMKNLSSALLVEASENQFTTLSENYKSISNVQLLHNLVTPDGEDCLFYEGGQGYTNSVLKRVIEYWEKEPILETKRQSLKFSTLVDEKVNWIHTDVEGLDPQLLMSLSDEQFRGLDIIIYEYNNSDPEEREIINEFLISKSFETFREEGVGICFRK
jgi:hypothetical protein